MNLRTAKKIYKRNTSNKYLYIKAKSRLNKHHALGIILIPKNIVENFDVEKWIEYTKTQNLFLDTDYKEYNGNSIHITKKNS